MIVQSRLKNEIIKLKSCFLNFTMNNILLSILIVYTIVNIFISIVFYPIIPVLLNYPPDSINTDFNIDVTYMQYITQYVVIIFIILLVGYALLIKVLRNINRLYKGKNVQDQKTLSKIRQLFFDAPYKIYSYQVIVPVSATILILFISAIDKNFNISSAKFITMFKLAIIIFSFSTSVAVINLLFTKKIFSKLLIATYDYAPEFFGKRRGVRNQILLQVFPMFLVAILFTGLFGYSKLISEKGNLIFEIYKNKLIEKFSESYKDNNISEVKKILESIAIENMKNSNFIIYSNGTFFTSDNVPLSDFFIKYASKISPKYQGHVYDFYGTNAQGAMIKLKTDKGYCMIGIKYEVSSNDLMRFFVTGFIILLGINLFILNYFSKSFSDDISYIADRLSDIATGQKIYSNKKIPVTSNDEIGDLVIAFNELQDHQESLKEGEKLNLFSSIVGKVAHNITTPTATIGNYRSLIKIETSQIFNKYFKNNEDLSESNILFECLNSDVDSIEPQITIINLYIKALRTLSEKIHSSEEISFTIDVLLQEIITGIEYEHIVIENNTDANLTLRLPKTVLLYILEEYIRNSVDEYTQKGKFGEDIKILVNSSERFLEFRVIDSGDGIDPEDEYKVFNEIYTTKDQKKHVGINLCVAKMASKALLKGDTAYEKNAEKGETIFLVTVGNSKIVSNSIAAS